MCAGQDGPLVVIRDEDRADSPLSPKSLKKLEDQIRVVQVAWGVKFPKNDKENKGDKNG